MNDIDAPPNQISSDQISSDRISSDQAAASRWRFSMRTLLWACLTIALICGNVVSIRKLRSRNAELQQLRSEVGYLGEHPDDSLVAVRLGTDVPLLWRMRVRVPATGRFRVAYSAMWPADTAQPEWFAAVPLQPGESIVTVQIAPDPRDEKWKISTLARHPTGSRRLASTLAPPLAEVFKGSHEVLRSGVGTVPVAVSSDQSVRLIEDRWIVGEGGQLLYGAAPPDADQPGIYVELQPDTSPL